MRSFFNSGFLIFLMNWYINPVLSSINENNLNNNNLEKISYHVVQRGENLTNISNKYKLSLEDLIKINNLKNPNLIVVGDKLFLNKKNFVETDNKSLIDTKLKKDKNLKDNFKIGNKQKLFKSENTLLIKGQSKFKKKFSEDLQMAKVINPQYQNFKLKEFPDYPIEKLKNTVRKNKDPFRKSFSLSINSNRNLYIELLGLFQIDDQKNAMFMTNKGIKNYLIGDKINNYYEIKDINLFSKEVFISDGEKTKIYKFPIR